MDFIDNQESVSEYLNSFYIFKAKQKEVKILLLNDRKRKVRRVFALPLIKIKLTAGKSWALLLKYFTCQKRA